METKNPRHDRGFLQRLRRFLLCEFLFANFGDLSELALFAFDNPLVDEEVVHCVRKLRAFADPVVDAFRVDFEDNGVRKWVVHPQDFERLSPWVTRFFTHDEAIGGLFLLSNACQTNR